MSDLSQKNLPVAYYYLTGTLTLQSPMLIGAGTDAEADIECVRDAAGNPFIPGTSLAGVLKSALREHIDTQANNLSQQQVKALIDQALGEEKDEGQQSAITVYDAVANNGARTRILDGVALDDVTRTALDRKKYDYEVVCEGVTFTLRLMAIRRQNDADTDALPRIFKTIAKLMEDGEIGLGAKTNRGLGKVQLSDIHTAAFNFAAQPSSDTQTALQTTDVSSKPDIQAWLDFNWDPFPTNREITNEPYDLSSPWNFIYQSDFQVADTLLIRDYAKSATGPDVTTLKNADGQALIPGTAWGGALRHALINIGRELGRKDRMTELCDQLFGKVDDQDKSEPTVGRVKVQQSKAGSKHIAYTRNKVDRFTGGVVNAALFTEEAAHQKGMPRLKLQIRNCKPYEAGMLILATKELVNGIQTVGGGYNIGRGRLQAGPPPKIELNGGNVLESDCLNALAVELENISQQSQPTGEHA